MSVVARWVAIEVYTCASIDRRLAVYVAACWVKLGNDVFFTTDFTLDL